MSAQPAPAVRPRADGMLRRQLGVLGSAHLSADLCQGAVPAMLPFLAHERGYSFAALGALVLAAGIGSSLLQPLLGVLSDRSRQVWMMPTGLVVAGGGVALAGLAPTYPLTAAALLVSGFGVAAFHPEAARFAKLASGTRPGRGMSWFSLGGNAGFALAPVLTAPLLIAFGLTGSLGLAILPLAGAAIVLANLGSLRALARSAGAAARGDDPDAVDHWGPFARLGAVVALRSGVYFGLQAFVPAYFVAMLSSSRTAASGALTVMLVSGAAGTLLGGLVADRLGPRRLLVATTSASPPLLIAFALVGDGVLATVLLGAIGFVTVASFSITVVLGQEYLPGRLGLASGVTLGLATGMGGVAASLLGVVGDAYGLHAIIWTVAALPLPTLALALSLPALARERPTSIDLAATPQPTT